jgi:hypothetical protein
MRVRMAPPQMTSAEFTTAMREAGFGVDHGRTYSDEARRIALRISPLVCPLSNQ